MTAGTRVAAFAALLVAIFALAAVAGGAIGPSTQSQSAEHDAHAPAATAAPTARDELRLAARDTTLGARRPERLRFAIEDARGARVDDFEIEQGRRMHLVVVRRDLRRFQHLHPTRDATGTWSVRLTLPTAGVYHAFADFQVAGRRHTLGVDLFVPGAFEPLGLPAPAGSAEAAGYDVSLQRHDGGELRFGVSRGGVAVTDLQPYLGARGHLVMLRAGDLAYEHVHPLATDTLAFHTGGAAPGTYRLFLQFRHRGTVRTVAFTHEVRR